MDSSSWRNVLTGAAAATRGAVTEARTRTEGVDFRERKKILDAAAQAALIEALNSTGVDARLVSEEGDAQIGRGGEWIVVADPIDGTTNLSKGLPPATVCLSASSTGMQSGVAAAVVQDLYTGEIFSAEKEKGATRNGEAIKPYSHRDANRALISLDLSKTPKLDRMTRFLVEARYLRMLGSSAIELCYVASGVFDAHVDIRGTLRSTDASAALLILSESGASYAVNGVVNGDFHLARDSVFELVAASTPLLLSQLLELTRG